MMIDIYYMVLLALFAVILTMMLLDKNVATFVVLCTNIVRIKIIRFIFMAKMYPRMKLDSIMIRYRLWKFRRELKR